MIATYSMSKYTSEREVESALVKRLIRGDPEAIQTLVMQYTDDVYRFVFNQVGGSIQDAEDIVQETFIAALKSIHSFRKDSKLRTWLFSIATHKVIDQQRWQARRPYTELSDETIALFAGGPIPEQIIETAEMRQALRQALMQLPPHYRTALILKYVEALSVDDIAVIMQRSFKSVESILVRARRALMSIVEEHNVVS